METLWKYCLSFLVVVLCFSCSSEKENVTNEERKNQAEKYYQESLFYYQGSPNSMLCLEKAVMLDSTHSYAIRELSVPYLKRGMPHQWKMYFDQAVKIDPESWQGWRGYLYLQFYRDYDKALVDFNATDSITPNFVDIIQGQSVDYWRGITYLAKEDYTQALNFFNRYIKFETEKLGEDWVETTAFLYRGITYLQLNEPEKALEDFNKQLLYSGNQSADAHYYKAFILLQQKKFSEALVSINNAIDDYTLGYKHNNPYTEVQYELYHIDLEKLKNEIVKIMES